VRAANVAEWAENATGATVPHVDANGALEARADAMVLRSTGRKRRKKSTRKLAFLTAVYHDGTVDSSRARATT
jgi:hypothetical protein